jgi:hypothetical protein
MTVDPEYYRVATLPISTKLCVFDGESGSACAPADHDGSHQIA